MNMHHDPTQATPIRPIRSFVLRAGRMSSRQKQGLEQWLPKYALALDDHPWDLSQLFDRSGEVILEIGFGMGQSLLTMALAYPELNFIGCEVHQAGVGGFAADLHDHALRNVRIAAFDVIAVLKHGIPDESLTGIQIFFPDPWPKARHHKRRLIQRDFVTLLTDKLKCGGFVHLATDWEDYAQQMLHVCSLEPRLFNEADDHTFIQKPEARPVTKFEKRGMKLGHKIWDLRFIRRSEVAQTQHTP